jgi:hypothetical protein
VTTTNTDLLNLGVDYGDAGPQIFLSGGQIPVTFPFNAGKGGFEDIFIANNSATVRSPTRRSTSRRTP